MVHPMRAAMRPGRLQGRVSSTHTDQSRGRVAILALLAACTTLTTLMALPAHAHRGWMLPSATVLSGENPWVTVDAATSNDLFYFEHNPLRSIENVQVIAPDGTTDKAENFSTGRYRSTFDVNLRQKGTYKLALVNESVTASYRVNGELKRWRGSAEAFKKDVPVNAPELTVATNNSRMEIFVTSGNPNETALKPTGKGLELVPVTHPNDLFAGETATFRFLIDGQPAAGIEVTVIPGGIRYRDRLNEQQVRTDADGSFTVQWSEPGMYWLNASYPARQREGGPEGIGMGGGMNGGMTGQAGTGGTGVGAQQPIQPVQPGARASYTATLEVLPQ